MVVVFFAFQSQENQKFYYAFNEKVPLSEVANKFVVRYSINMDKRNASNSIKKSFANSSEYWHDEKTVILTLEPSINKKEAIENLRNLPEALSCQPLFKISSGLEMVITNEFIVKFKDNIGHEEQQKINQSFGVSLLKSTDTY